MPTHPSSLCSCRIDLEFQLLVWPWPPWSRNPLYTLMCVLAQCVCVGWRQRTPLLVSKGQFIHALCRERVSSMCSFVRALVVVSFCVYWQCSLGSEKLAFHRGVSVCVCLNCCCFSKAGIPFRAWNFLFSFSKYWADHCIVPCWFLRCSSQDNTLPCFALGHLQK